MEPYYYMQLDKQQQAAYRDMKAGLQALSLIHIWKLSFNILIICNSLNLIL